MYGVQVGISQSGLRTRHAQTRYYIGTGQAIRHINFPRSIFSWPPLLLGLAPHGWRNSGFRYGMTFTTKSTSHIYTCIYIFVQPFIDQFQTAQLSQC